LLHGNIDAYQYVGFLFVLLLRKAVVSFLKTTRHDLAWFDKALRIIATTHDIAYFHCEGNPL